MPSQLNFTISEGMGEQPGDTYAHQVLSCSHVPKHSQRRANSHMENHKELQVLPWKAGESNVDLPATLHLKSLYYQQTHSKGTL